MIYITHASRCNQSLICTAYGRRRRENLVAIGIANKQTLYRAVKVISVVTWALVGLGSW